MVSFLRPGLAWLLIWLVAFAAPAQALQVLRAQEISKTSMKASLHTRSYPINSSDPSGLDAYVWVRQQDNAKDTGHVWLEVDQGSAYTRFSAGHWPGGFLSPDPDGNIASKPYWELKQGQAFKQGDYTYRLAKRYTLSSSENQDFIDFIKKDMSSNKNTQLGQWGGSVSLDAVLKSGGDPKNLVNFCSTTAERWLRQGGVDESLPRIVEPNNLYNFYNPGGKITPGGHKWNGKPVDGAWGR